MSDTPTIREAAQYAGWWSRMALDLAPDEPGLHPGVISHLTAANAQHWAVEQLLGANECASAGEAG